MTSWRSHGTPYPGDFAAKREARLLLYLRVMQMHRAAGHDRLRGQVVTLAGLGAPEVPLVRHLLGVSSDRALFVDEKDHAIESAQRAWPEVRVWHGRIADALHALRTESVSFLNFDFTGHFNAEVEASFKAAAGKIESGGVLAFFFERSREFVRTPHWNTMIEHTKQVLDRSLDLSNGSLDREIVRFRGYMHLIRQRMGDHFYPVFSLRYNTRLGNGRSKVGTPMGVIVLQNTNERITSSTTWRYALSAIRTSEERAQRIPIRRNEDEAVSLYREAALDLMGSMSNREIAEALNVPIDSVRAWHAHLTRGTYPNR